MCVDYRALNSVTLKNTYPLPRISECRDRLGAARYYTKLDCLSGYWQVRLKDEDREKTAFNTRMGKFEYKVMPFGLCNAPATFQSIMNELLREALDEYVIVYLDDILIYSKTKEEHFRHIRRVFELLESEKFYLKLNKCEFAKESISFVGYIISQGIIRMDDRKIQAIKNWPRSKTTRHIRQFLGLTGWYMDFIKNYAETATPLTDLTKGTVKEEKVKWLPIHEVAFQKLKKEMCEEPVLKQPEHEKPFQIATDASDRATGGVLSQADEKGRYYLVAYTSKKLSPTETRYMTQEKELLAIIRALRAWKHYIYGKENTVVYTDHHGLKYLNTVKNPSKRLERWLEEFQGHNIDIRYKPGKQMTVPDAFSRRPDYIEEELVLLMKEQEEEWPNYVHKWLTQQLIDSQAKQPRSGDSELDKIVKRRSPEFRLDTEGNLEHRNHEGNYVRYLNHWGRADTIESAHDYLGHAGAKAILNHLRVRCGGLRWQP
jgi:hypothetical protein